MTMFSRQALRHITSFVVRAMCVIVAFGALITGKWAMALWMVLLLALTFDKVQTLFLPRRYR